MDVKLIGAESCPMCLSLEKKVKDVAEELGVNATISKVTDVEEIAKYGVFAIPALVINGEVKAVGQSPRKKQIVKWMSESN